MKSSCLCRTDLVRFRPVRAAWLNRVYLAALVGRFPGHRALSCSGSSGGVFARVRSTQQVRRGLRAGREMV
jgi:hypothetical protein